MARPNHCPAKGTMKKHEESEAKVLFWADGNRRPTWTRSVAASYHLQTPASLSIGYFNNNSYQCKLTGTIRLRFTKKTQKSHIEQLLPNNMQWLLKQKIMVRR